MNAAVADVQRCTKVLFEREWIRSQSKMVAYDRVGSQVGAAAAGVLYRDFFMKDRNGVPKGVVNIDLGSLP